MLTKPNGVANFSVSQDGTLAYLTVGAGDLQRTLVSLGRDGIVDPIETIPADRCESSRLSPDGGRVLVWTDGDAWICDLTSSRASRVTSDGLGVWYGEWDPTGMQVAYSSARSGNVNVWVESSDGSGEPRQVTTLGGAVHVGSWSPDGKILSVHHHTPEDEVNMLMIRMGEANPEPQGFFERAQSEEGGVFSSDGRYVAYQSNETGQREIYIQPYPGPGGQETVSVGGGREPVWATNGELLSEPRWRSCDGSVGHDRTDVDDGHAKEGLTGKIRL